MNIYDLALNQIFEELNKVKETFNIVYGYDIIKDVSKRIKTPDSIVDKMEKKHYELNLKNMVQNINDIAGIRISCLLKSDIYKVINIIKEMQNIKVISNKDYMSKPKKSGYSGYHLIIETPVQVEQKEIPVKVEIQIRTMAMDFWATNEHKIRYKSKTRISTIDSHRLTAYAKIINIIDDKIMEIYNKQKLA